MTTLPQPDPTAQSSADRACSTSDQEQAADQLLRRLGWDAGQLAQARIYAQMAPARKVALMLRWRAMQIEMLRRQLQAQHPGLTAAQLGALVLRRLELVREQHL